jgi:hypothetical protein
MPRFDMKASLWRGLRLGLRLGFGLGLIEMLGQFNLVPLFFL